jgi:MFS transporter, DHA1 family, inner membrane transport protein
MPFFSNRDINRLGLQAATGTLASALSYVFSAVFLLHAGLTPAQIFLAFAAILALRFVMRPLILVVAPAIGLRRALILGTFLCALSCPVLALVDGIGPALAAFVAVAAMGQVFYCTCYHVFFTTLGDADHRGSQVGAVQALGALAAVCGPALGGFLLAALGPGATFGAAFVIALLSIVPLLHLAEPKIARERPPRAYAAARTGMWLYFADGWIQVSLTTGWSHAVWLNAGVLVVGLVLRSAVGDSATAAVAVAVGTTLFSGLYLPTWMTPVYNAAKLAPCALRFQFAAEGGWDAAGTLAGLIATGFCLFGLPLATTILLALPMVLLQGLLLEHSYAAQHGRDNERAAVRAAI